MMQGIEKIFDWFFATPTSIIALVSAIIALLAYKYQRRLQKKYNACLIAERYAKEILPRMRIFKSILEDIGVIGLLPRIEEVSRFDLAELKELLQRDNKNVDTIKMKFNTITTDMWKKAILKTGSDFCSKEWYNMLAAEIDTDPSIISISFEKFAHNLLNDLEAMATSLRYNVADEKLIYQSLHQTYINYKRIFYFFISNENTLDENRYYENVVWLYCKWENRKQKQHRKYQKRVNGLRVGSRV